MLVFPFLGPLPAPASAPTPEAAVVTDAEAEAEAAGLEAVLRHGGSGELATFVHLVLRNLVPRTKLMHVAQQMASDDRRPSPVLRLVLVLVLLCR